MLNLGWRSLWNRRFVAALTILSIALSVALILGIERLRADARASFANSASGIDLIIASRGSSVQILMATVFGSGTTGTGISWDAFEMVEDLPQVVWAVPISMGDNHRGHPVIGTSAQYFEHFRHSGGQPLAFTQGNSFSDSQSAVIGAKVAERHDYRPGATIVNAHGTGNVAFDVHDEAAFTITGVLEPTGTAADSMVYVSLEGFDALHRDDNPPEPDPFDLSGTQEITQSKTKKNVPDQINAIFVGLSDPTAILSVQRAVLTYPAESLTAVLPAVALLELWSITATAENALLTTSWAVAVAGLLSMVVMLSATLEARRREFAILRSVGATPFEVLGLIIIEAFLLSLAGIVLGLAIRFGVLLAVAPVLSAQFGIQITFSLPSLKEVQLVGIIVSSGILAGLIPALRVYRMTLADGLGVKL